MGRLKFAMVCASNQNRSMAAHAALKESGFIVSSYGTGSQVKLPGPSAWEPNVFSFGTSYKQMYDELRKKDAALYNRNGCLKMLRRNAQVKPAPQRWQDNAADGSFDVVLTFEERIFDIVTEDLQSRGQKKLSSVLVINIDVKDNHEEANIAAKLAHTLSQWLEEVENWEDEVDKIMQRFEKTYKRQPIYTVCFY